MTTTNQNIVLIVLDTTRASSLSHFNEDSETITPFLDSFFENNVSYTNCYSPAPWTLPAHASLFTGELPHAHGVNQWDDKLASDKTTVAELLRSHGYDTVGITNNTWVNDLFGLDQGFDQFYKIWQLIQHRHDLIETRNAIDSMSGIEKYIKIMKDVYSNNFIVNLINGIYGRSLHNRKDKGSTRINKISTNWVKNNNSSRPFFMFINYLEPHMPYDPPERFALQYLSEREFSRAKKIDQSPIQYMLGERSISEYEAELLKKLYMGEISYLDSKIKLLFRSLQENIDWDNTSVIITGDHGENIGENGLMSHFYTLNDNLTHVPCGAKLRQSSNEVIEDQLQLTDIFAMILEEAGLSGNCSDKHATLPNPYHEGTARSSSISELLGVNPPREAIIRRTGGQYNKRKFDRLSRRQQSIRNGEYTLFLYEDGETELCDIRGDLVDDSDIESELKSELIGFSDENIDDTEKAQLNSNARAHLEDLGYL